MQSAPARTFGSRFLFSSDFISRRGKREKKKEKRKNGREREKRNKNRREEIREDKVVKRAHVPSCCNNSIKQWQSRSCLLFISTHFRTINDITESKQTIGSHLIALLRHLSPFNTTRMHFKVASTTKRTSHQYNISQLLSIPNAFP